MIILTHFQNNNTYVYNDQI